MLLKLASDLLRFQGTAHEYSKLISVKIHMLFVFLPDQCEIASSTPAIHPIDDQTLLKSVISDKTSHDDSHTGTSAPVSHYIPANLQNSAIKGRETWQKKFFY